MLIHGLTNFISLSCQLLPRYRITKFSDMHMSLRYTSACRYHITKLHQNRLGMKDIRECKKSLPPQTVKI